MFLRFLELFSMVSHFHWLVNELAIYIAIGSLVCFEPCRYHSLDSTTPTPFSIIFPSPNHGKSPAHGVNHPEPRAFSYSITLLILLHVILLGVEVDLSAAVALEDMPSWLLRRGVFSIEGETEITCRQLAVLEGSCEHRSKVKTSCGGMWWEGLKMVWWGLMDKNDKSSIECTVIG